MQDRVSEHPGRIKLTPVPGQENTFDMVRADEPVQEGTPLNKATLLTDEVAAEIAALSGADIPGTPNEAQKLLSSAVKRPIELAGVVEYNGEKFRVAPDATWFFPFYNGRAKKNGPMFVNRNIIAYIGSTAQTYYDRHTGELLETTKLSLQYSSDRPYYLNYRHCTENFIVMNTKGYGGITLLDVTSKAMFSSGDHTYDGSYTMTIPIGFYGDYFYYMYRYGYSSYKVERANISTMTKDGTFSRTPQYISSAGSGVWAGGDGVYIQAYRSDGMLYLYTQNIITGVSQVFTGPAVGGYSVSLSFVDPENHKVYVVYGKSSSYDSCGVFDYSDGTFSEVVASDASSVPQYYFGNIDDNTIIGRNSSGYMIMLDLTTGKVLKVSSNTVYTVVIDTKYTLDKRLPIINAGYTHNYDVISKYYLDTEEMKQKRLYYKESKGVSSSYLDAGAFYCNDNIIYAADESAYTSNSYLQTLDGTIAYDVLHIEPITD